MVKVRDDNGHTEVKCGICGFVFDSVLVEEERHEGYFDDTYKVKVLKPVGPKENPPHLLKNYVCDKCYRHLGDAVKESLIEDCDKHIEKFDERCQIEKENYLRKISEIEAETNETKRVREALKKLKNLSDIPVDLLEAIKRNYHIFNTYYLDAAYEKDMKEKKKLCSVFEWERQYGINNRLITYSDSRFEINHKLISLKDWRQLIEDADISDMSVKEICNLLKRIDDDIEKRKG